MSESKEKWSEWINSVLQHSGLNASELAVRIGVSRMSVSKWRNPRYPNIPSPEHREKLLIAAKDLGLL